MCKTPTAIARKKDLWRLIVRFSNHVIRKLITWLVSPTRFPNDMIPSCIIRNIQKTAFPIQYKCIKVFLILWFTWFGLLITWLIFLITWFLFLISWLAFQITWLDLEIVDCTYGKTGLTLLVRLPLSSTTITGYATQLRNKGIVVNVERQSPLRPLRNKVLGQRWTTIPVEALEEQGRQDLHPRAPRPHVPRIGMRTSTATWIGMRISTVRTSMVPTSTCPRNFRQLFLRFWSGKT